MPELRIKTAIDNGDLPEEKFHLFPVWTDDYKFTTIGDALKNTAVIKKYNEQYEREFGSPSVFASPTKVPRSEKT